jgi:tetratricopeptide (TPR) repeat protein
MSTITRGAFESCFQSGTIEELTERASGRGVEMTDAQRQALTDSDLNGDGVIGNTTEERRAVWNHLDDLDSNGSRRSMSSSTGDGQPLARALTVPGSYFRRTEARDDYAAGERAFARGQRLEAAGDHAGAERAYERAAQIFQRTQGTIDTPQGREAEYHALVSAARCAYAAGDTAHAAELAARAAEVSAARTERYPNAPALPIPEMPAA